VARVLFVTSEAYPWLKTGGLADVSYSLPMALHGLGEDVRVLMPAYRDVLAKAQSFRQVAEFELLDQRVSLLEGRLAENGPLLWLLAHPGYDRPGNPYLAPDGRSWPDNAERFALLCRAAVAIAQGRAGLDWLPELVHGNDWQSGLVPALLAGEGQRPATVFTVHNLAYQGLFPAEIFQRLQLPPSLWSMAGAEFHGQLSFMKAGLAYADRITTVSPTYAAEIQTSEFGCGLEGLLAHRQAQLYGIVNGIDEDQWDPAQDGYLPANYHAGDLQGKAACKAALQQRFGLADEAYTPLLCFIGRLVQQKGVDLLLQALPALLHQPVQLAFLGAGNSLYEQSLLYWARRYPRRIGVVLGYNEALAHQMEAGADLFLMPSRFEPCGLNQMYSQRYGTPPIVHSVGGLADTVVDATLENLAAQTASGFRFGAATPSALLDTLRHALTLYHDKPRWLAIQQAGMRRDFSWKESARRYQEIYRQCLA
jgi:starch synthase